MSAASLDRARKFARRHRFLLLLSVAETRLEKATSVPQMLGMANEMLHYQAYTCTPFFLSELRVSHDTHWIVFYGPNKFLIADLMFLSNVALLHGLPLLKDAPMTDNQAVLLTDQKITAENGFWHVHPGEWTRPTPDISKRRIEKNVECCPPKYRTDLWHIRHLEGLKITLASRIANVLMKSMDAPRNTEPE